VTGNNRGRPSGIVIPLFLHFLLKPSTSDAKFGSWGPWTFPKPSRTTSTHQLFTIPPRWNLTSKIFQLPFLTSAFPTLYDRRGGGSSRAGITAISESMIIPKPLMGDWTGLKPRVGKPWLMIDSALTAGGLHAKRIICLVSLSLSFPSGCPGKMSHNSAGTQIIFFLLPISMTGRSVGYLSLIPYSKNL
jgi:hypothetical protein